MSPTGNSDTLVCLLSSCKEDDILLGCVDIVIFQKENLVNTVVLKSGEVDEQPDGTGQRLLDYKILLASDLCRDSIVEAERHCGGRALHTPSSRFSKPLRNSSLIESVSMPG